MPKVCARLKLWLLAGTLAGAFFLFGQTAFAQAPADQNFGLTAGANFGQVGIAQGSDLTATIARILNIAFGFLGIIAVILAIYAGFLWMTAHGNEDQVSRAKLILRNALIGLAIVLSAWGITAFIISRLSGVGSGGGGDGGGGGCVGAGCLGGGLPSERFTLQEFQTLHAGKTSRDDVFRCSNVQTRFNQWLDVASIAAARTGLKAASVGDVTYTGEVQSHTPSVLAVDVDARGNSLRFERRDNNNPATRINWPPNSQIELQVPKAITNQSNQTLADCTALGCNDRGAYYAWLFTTSDKLDTTKPTVASAYPRLPGSIEGYPDRNVDRSLTFSVNFSKAVDFFSVVRPDNRLIPENVKIEQIVSDKDPRSVAIIPTEHFDASLAANGFQFALNRAHQSALNDGPYLEPYAWYRITLKNIVDLCNNQLAGETSWIFETNGNIPGVAFTYPADGYQFACPNTEAFVQFRTSMYDVKNSSCAVNPVGGGLVQSGSGVAGRQLRVADNVPNPPAGAPPVNPNEFCKRYDFAPSASQLSANTKYSPAVTYRNPANDSQTNNANWSFDVKPADGCANAPYISNLSPMEGPWGRCLTIQGNYFGAVDKRQSADNAYTKLNFDSPRNLLTNDGNSNRIRGNWSRAWNDGAGASFNIKNEQWADTYLTGEFPNVAKLEDAEASSGIHTDLLPPAKDGILDFDVFVARNITLGGKVEKLQSNITRFSVPIASPAYQGPCLYSLSSTSGPWGSKTNLTGTNFLPTKDAPVGDVIFETAVSALAAKWDNNLISEAAVPAGSISGEVKVQTKQGLSNGIRFNITAEKGGACIPNTDCGLNQTCNPRGICEDRPQPNGFLIDQAWPASACSAACKNAEVGLRANLSLVPATLKPVVYGSDGVRTAGSLAVRKCRADDCRELVGGNLAFTTALSEDNKKLALKWPLEANASYRVIIYGGDNGLRSTDPNKSLLVNTNYHTNESNDDAYAWYFKVSPNDCAVDRVRINKTNLDLYEKDSSDIMATAFAKPDQCSPQDGQIINAPANFNWQACVYPADGNLTAACSAVCPAPQTDNKPIMALQSQADKSRGPVNIVTGLAGTKSGNRAVVCAGYGSGAFTATTAVTVRSLCGADTDCQQGNLCPNSTCNLEKTSPNFGRCAPVIKDITPSDGQSGTWATVSGCYFGNTRGTVKYNATPFLEPAMCGNTWSDQQIIAEVPVLAAGTVGGPGDVMVEATNKMSVTRAQGFNLNDVSHPGLCRLEPNYGPAGGEVRLMGKNFGVKEGSEVKFAALAAPVYKSWSDTNIVVATPALPGSETPVKVKVIKGSNSSGELNFRVISGNGGGPGQVTPRDLQATAYFPGAGKNACPNQVIEVHFSGSIDRASLTAGEVAATTPNNFLIQRLKTKEYLAGTVVLQLLDNGDTALSFTPADDLASGENYQIILKAGAAGLRSDTGGQLVVGGICPAFDSAGNCLINFTAMATGSPEAVGCQAQALTVEPRSPIFTCAGTDDCGDDFDKSKAGNQQVFRARTISRNSQPVVVRKGYDWNIKDQLDKDDQTILSFSDDAKYATSSVRILAVQPKNGSTIIQAKPIETTIQGNTEARVWLCKNPWPALAPTRRFVPFLDNNDRPQPFNRPLDHATNFSTFYCRDKGKAGPEEDLPEIALKAEVGKDGKDQTDKVHEPVAGLLKEFFFTVPRNGTQTTDAIGLRVLSNPNNYPVGLWYNIQGFAGQTQSLKVDGYDALQDGRTVYVNAPNDKDGDVDDAGVAQVKETIYSNIYLASVSDQAQTDTQNIFNQLLNNWRFAANLKQADNRAKLQRDSRRLTDLTRLISLIDAKAAPPTLASGSFQKNVSVSVWPSWQQTLAADLGGALPLDPLNTVDDAACAAVGADKGTCWLPVVKQFKCLANNSVYRYESIGGKQYKVQARLEYQGQTRANISASGWSFVAGEACGNLLYSRE